ncbi:hypothetical protein VKT23_013722 [Stygiomarasmius scandens]|uniref:Uncharacterized protein n=1 Tax=Marasmiellus scandens TaxID=2682957 RepID=A0ABR1J7E8_9AGAR
MVDDVSDIDNAKELSGIWETVRSQMPLLTHIVVQVPPLASHLDQITQLIKNLPQLKSLELPAFEETSKILPCVLGISQLKRMKFNFSFIPSSESNDDKIISIRDVGCYMDSPDLDIPPQLEDIDFHCASLGATMAFFQSRGFSQLTHLRTICTAAIEEPPLLGQFVTTISQTCRQITNFEFVLYSAVSKRILESQDSPDLPVLTCREIVSFSNIRGILNCNEMIEFSFRHPYGLDITDFDIKELATAWPKLKSVRLGSNPVQRVDRGLIRNPTMNAFVSFVEHCPLIEEIYLIVDATLPLNLPKGSTTASQTLHTIGVGISEIGDENAVVMFLSQLCGPQCKLLRASVDRFEKLRSKSMHSKWQKVAKLLPLLTGFKGQFDAKDEGDIG